MLRFSRKRNLFHYFALFHYVTISLYFTMLTFFKKECVSQKGDWPSTEAKCCGMNRCPPGPWGESLVPRVVLSTDGRVLTWGPWQDSQALLPPPPLHASRLRQQAVCSVICSAMICTLSEAQSNRATWSQLRTNKTVSWIDLSFYKLIISSILL